MKCDRCGREVERAYPLDRVIHGDETTVCVRCVKPWDEVVDL